MARFVEFIEQIKGNGSRSIEIGDFPAVILPLLLTFINDAPSRPKFAPHNGDIVAFIAQRVVASFWLAIPFLFHEAFSAVNTVF